MTEHIIKVPVQTVNHIDKILSLVRTGHPAPYDFSSAFSDRERFTSFLQHWAGVCAHRGSKMSSIDRPTPNPTQGNLEHADGHSTVYNTASEAISAETFDNLSGPLVFRL